MRESLIEKHFIKRVKEMGGETRKVKWIGRRHAPDRVAMFPPTSAVAFLWLPTTAWVELKASDKTARAGQLREHNRMRNLGQTVVVLDSIEAIDNWFGVGE